MPGQQVLLPVNFIAGAAITAKRILFVTATDTVQHANSNTAAMVAVSMADAASGARVDAQMLGIATVKTGGVVSLGDWLTSNATGLAITSAPGAGTNHQVIGRALKAGASGDEIPVLLAPGQNQG